MRICEMVEKDPATEIFIVQYWWHDLLRSKFGGEKEGKKRKKKTHQKKKKSLFKF